MKRVFSSPTRPSPLIPHSLITPNLFLILTMRFASTIITLAALFSVAIACPPVTPPPTVEPVRPNGIYGNGGDSLNIVACSNGPNGMITKGFTTFNSLPTFPNIGGGFTVGGWGSAECGSCWKLTNPANGVTIFVTAIDTISSGFDLAPAAVSTLIGGPIPPSFNEVDVDATEVAHSFCGLPP